ncbi:DUF2059 domain-containing protein [Flavobacterium limnophilum]|uniref:DUF2059 domain-containing protein n=1 Tax=Flavobacterium limnophilum TaxID=3003262 RepID=UPI002482C521|nr:DUF2059 domain-containing protein [Flavobacterium limnophilum]
MKKVILILMICMPLLMGYSQTKQESIKELFHVMQQDSIMDKMFNSMIPSMINQMKSQHPINDSLANARSNELMKATMQTTKVILKKMMDEDMVALYDKYFSQKEINDYIVFYKSPSGQKFIKVTPDISKDLMEIMMQKYIPEIQNAIKTKVEEMKMSEKK